jgi:hypothetical protein
MVAPLAAAPIPVGTSTGTLAIHYNVGEPETPSEQGYIKSQFSPLNTNGAAASYFPPFAAVFGDVGQFGFDMVIEAPTHDGSLDPIPFLTAVDYDGVGPVAAGPVAWAVNDYKPGVPGPGTPGNIPYNSLFRGPSVEVTTSLLSVVGTVFTVEISGKLISDGFIHWFSPGAGTTPISSTGLRNNFLFSGIFSYDSATDTTPGIDYYSGSATFFVLPVPEPGSAMLLGLGSVVMLAGARFRRNRSAME